MPFLICRRQSANIPSTPIDLPFFLESGLRKWPWISCQLRFSSSVGQMLRIGSSCPYLWRLVYGRSGETLTPLNKTVRKWYLKSLAKWSTRDRTSTFWIRQGFAPFCSMSITNIISFLAFKHGPDHTTIFCLHQSQLSAYISPLPGSLARGTNAGQGHHSRFSEVNWLCMCPQAAYSLTLPGTHVTCELSFVCVGCVNKVFGGLAVIDFPRKSSHPTCTANSRQNIHEQDS
jgi:hypothetical protein